MILLPLQPDAVMCFHYATLGPVQLWQPVSHCRRRKTAARADAGARWRNVLGPHAVRQRDELKNEVNEEQVH